jgi:hypothetical protein
MSDDVQPPPYVYEGLDPVPEPKSTMAEATGPEERRRYVGDAIDKGRKPGMPLSILSNIAREAAWLAADRSAGRRRGAAEMLGRSLSARTPSKPELVIQSASRTKRALNISPDVDDGLLSTPSPRSF